MPETRNSVTRLKDCTAVVLVYWFPAVFITKLTEGDPKGSAVVSIGSGTAQNPLISLSRVSFQCRQHYPFGGGFRELGHPLLFGVFSDWGALELYP